jgi:hypothetical protein
MSESRQVRRARERAEAKAARRSPQPTIEQTVVVELSRYAEDPADYVSVDELDDEPDEYVSWHATWGLEDSSVGAEHSEAELQELVDTITRDLSRWGEHYSFELKWTLRGDPPADGTLDDAVTETGVDLPTRWPTPS